MESNLTLQLKLYDRSYIDDWLLLNFTLTSQQLLKIATVTSGSSFEVKELVTAFISYGKYFDTLVHRKCQLANFTIFKQISTADDVTVTISNSTCFASHDAEDIVISLSEPISVELVSIDITSIGPVVFNNRYSIEVYSILLSTILITYANVVRI